MLGSFGQGSQSPGAEFGVWPKSVVAEFGGKRTYILIAGPRVFMPMVLGVSIVFSITEFSLLCSCLLCLFPKTLVAKWLG